MGIELARFAGDVDDELVCPICMAVLEDPVQVEPCGHAFCRSCIMNWIWITEDDVITCPVDRQPMAVEQLKPLPRLVLNMLAKLMVSCAFKEHGCSSLMRLETLQDHVSSCDFNPKTPEICPGGCGLIVPRDELEGHNCVRDLRSLICEQKEEISHLQEEIKDTLWRQEQIFQSSVMCQENIVSNLQHEINGAKSVRKLRTKVIEKSLRKSISNQGDKVSQLQQEIHEEIDDFKSELQILKNSLTEKKILKPHNELEQFLKNLETSDELIQNLFPAVDSVTKSLRSKLVKASQVSDRPAARLRRTNRVSD